MSYLDQIKRRQFLDVLKMYRDDGKPLRSRSYLSFNFAIAKICVAIRLAKDGKRMGDIQFQLSPRIVSIEIFTIFVAIFFFH